MYLRVQGAQQRVLGPGARVKLNQIEAFRKLLVGTPIIARFHCRSRTSALLVVRCRPELPNFRHFLKI